MKPKVKWSDILICDKCGKKMPIDKENSTSECWVVYKTECECGGKSKVKLEEME